MKRTLQYSNLIAAVTALCAISSTSIAHSAQSYPSQPIRVIVPFAPGGSTDIVARIVTQRMAKELGQPLIIENRAGAGGAIGAAEAAKAAPDGYTLSIATVSTMAVNSACRPKDLPYDPIADFAPVTNFVNVPFVIEVNNGFPAQNFEEFLKELKHKPNHYSYGSSGTCSVLHLFGESFKSATDVDIMHVPYKGAAPAVQDTVAGQIQIMFDNLPASMSQIQAGNLRPIAVAWPNRWPTLPDVPTLAEAGYSELNRLGWYGLLAPKNTPTDVINRLRNAAVIALKDASVVEVLSSQGAAPSGNTPQEFAVEIKNQYDWARDVVHRSNIKLQR